MRADAARPVREGRRRRGGRSDAGGGGVPGVSVIGPAAISGAGGGVGRPGE